MLNTFFYYTLIFWVANVCFVRLMHLLIQPGQLFGRWQNVLTRMYQANSRLLNELAKPLGECELCFSHFITMITFGFYFMFMKLVVGFWITTPVHSWLLKIVICFGWYVIYASIGTIISLFTLLKFSKKK